MGESRDAGLAWCERSAEACVRTVLEDGAELGAEAVVVIVQIGIGTGRVASAGRLRSIVRPGGGPLADAALDDCALSVLASLLECYSDVGLRMALEALADASEVDGLARIDAARPWLEGGRIKGAADGQ